MPEAEQWVHADIATPSPERIYWWNFDRMRRILNECGQLQPDFVMAALQEYKRYIFLRATHMKLQLTVSPLVDEIWHAHLLMPTDYYAMCMATAGEIIEHTTALGRTESRDAIVAYSRTLTLYERTFREKPPLQFWPLLAF